MEGYLPRRQMLAWYPGKRAERSHQALISVLISALSMCARCGCGMGFAGCACGTVGGSVGVGRFRDLSTEDLEEYLVDLNREVDRVQGRLAKARDATQ